MHGAAAVVLLLTERAAISEHCARELELALDAKVPIYPVRLGADEIPPEMRYYLAGVQWITPADGWVARLAASLPASSPAASEAEPTTGDSGGVEVPGQGTWTPAMLATLHEHLRYPLVRLLLDLCAATPSAWIPKAQVDEQSERGPLQLRNELGAFSKLNRKLFGEVSWPMEWRKVDGRYEYRMAEELATIWRSLSQAAPSTS